MVDFGRLYSSERDYGDFPSELFDKCFAVEEGFEIDMTLKIRTTDMTHSGKKSILLEIAAGVEVVAYSDRLCLPDTSEVQTNNDSECNFRAYTEGEQPVVIGGQTASNSTDITILFNYKCKAGPCKCGECLSSPAPYGSDICVSQYAKKKEEARDRRSAGIRGDGTPTLAPYNQPGSTWPCCTDGMQGPAGGDAWCNLVFTSKGDQYGYEDGDENDSPISLAFRKAYDDAMREVSFCCKLSGLPRDGKTALENFLTAWSEASRDQDCTSV